jgi:hypothetical protein
MTQQVLHRYAMPNSTHLSQQLVMFDEPLAKLIVKVEKVVFVLPGLRLMESHHRFYVLNLFE